MEETYGNIVFFTVQPKTMVLTRTYHLAQIIHLRFFSQIKMAVNVYIRMNPINDATETCPRGKMPVEFLEDLRQPRETERDQNREKCLTSVSFLFSRVNVFAIVCIIFVPPLIPLYHSHHLLHLRCECNTICSIAAMSVGIWKGTPVAASAIAPSEFSPIQNGLVTPESSPINVHPPHISTFTKRQLLMHGPLSFHKKEEAPLS